MGSIHGSHGGEILVGRRVGFPSPKRVGYWESRVRSVDSEVMVAG